MRLATITNWAYGVTVGLTLISGSAMLLATSAHHRERAAVEQRYELDQASARLGTELMKLTAQARQYVGSGDPALLREYRREMANLASVEKQLRDARAIGARPGEIAAMHDAIDWTEKLRAEERSAIAAYHRGDRDAARSILFGASYERLFEQLEQRIENFQHRLDQRTHIELVSATRASALWRTTSQVMIAITALLFLAVLYFVFKRRVIRPVVRLSDVIGRLAHHDYSVEIPIYRNVDEIGDISAAVRLFREHAVERQRMDEQRLLDHALRDLLARMTQRLQGCDTLHDLEQVVARFVPQIAPHHAGRLYLLDPSRNALVEACSWLDPRLSRSEFTSMSCWALRRGGAHRPGGDQIDVPCEHLGADLPAGTDTLCLPLIAQRETLGLLYFELPAPGQVPGCELTAQVYLTMLAETIGLAVANLHLRETLRAMAMTDPLTGLANRRHLDAVLDDELARAGAAGEPVSCIMIDVDHFKRFNDTHGHDAGDAVLRAVGKVLKRVVREGELAFRVGGEEFMLLLPGCGTHQAQARGAMLRGLIADLQLSHDGAPLGPITVSQGVATVPVHCPPARMIATADAALLRAKEDGRDRVVVAVQRADRVAAA